MARGREKHQARMDAVAAWGKALAKRAGFHCEWCGASDALLALDLAPKAEPSLETLILLCGPCRELHAGRGQHGPRLRTLAQALWSEHPCVAHSVARVLARSKELWAREALEDSYLPDELKQELLGQ